MSGLSNANGFSVSRTSSYTELQVTSLNVVNALVGGLTYGADTLTAVTAVADVTTPLTFLDTTAGAQTVSLAAGKVGQQKQFIMVVDNGDSVLTPATTAGTYANITFANVGECVTLVYTAVGWAIVSRSSGDSTSSATSVAGYPAPA